MTSTIATRAIHPRTGRPAGRLEGGILLACACMAVLAAVLMAPNLPRLQQAYADTPGVAALAPMVVTVPALMVGLTAGLAGRLADRVGRKNLLVWALVGYSIAGTAPLWLQSLEQIVASRVLVGLCEAAIMTCSTTLLADYFHGRDRERYFGYQVMATTIAATVLFGVGGALGAAGWRTPFWLYAVGVVLAALVAVFLFQAEHHGEDAGALVRVPWRRLALPVVVTFVGGLVFYVLIVELSYRLDALGITNPATIGMAAAVASVGTAVGAYTFTRIAPRGPAVTVPLAFLLSGLGLVGMGLLDAFPLVLAAAVVTGFGNGLLLPSLLTWALSPLTFEQRARGTGVWSSANFLGNFASPLVVIAVAALAGGIGVAIAVVGAVSLAVGVALRLGRLTASGATAIDGANAPGVAH